jgi:hypothetical protein
VGWKASSYAGQSTVKKRKILLFSGTRSMITTMHENYSNTDIFTGAKNRTLFSKLTEFGAEQLPFAPNMRPFPIIPAYLQP